jgi:hypothetical protein
MSRVHFFGASAAGDAGTHSTPTYEFRSPGALDTGVRGVLATYVLLTLVLLGVMAYGLQLLQQGIDGGATVALQENLARAGALQSNLLRLQTLLMLACFGWAGCWIYRMACNVRALGAKGLDDSPGWAVGWYAVPVLNLMRPLHAMSQIWLASRAPARWQKLETPRLLAAWWGCWLAGNLFQWIVARYVRLEHTYQGLHTQQWLLFCGQALNLAAAGLFLLVVWRLTRMQLNEHARQQSVPATTAPSLADAFVA